MANRPKKKNKRMNRFVSKYRASSVPKKPQINNKTLSFYEIEETKAGKLGIENWL